MTSTVDDTGTHLAKFHRDLVIVRDRETEFSKFRMST